MAPVRRRAGANHPFPEVEETTCTGRVPSACRELSSRMRASSWRAPRVPAACAISSSGN